MHTYAAAEEETQPRRYGHQLPCFRLFWSPYQRIRARSRGPARVTETEKDGAPEDYFIRERLKGEKGEEHGAQIGLRRVYTLKA